MTIRDPCERICTLDQKLPVILHLAIQGTGASRAIALSIESTEDWKERSSPGGSGQKVCPLLREAIETMFFRTSYPDPDVLTT